MKRKIALLLLICLSFVLCGCDLWMDGAYYSVQPHQNVGGDELLESATATSYPELQKILVEMVEKGQQSTVIYMPGLQTAQLDSYMKRAISELKYKNPVAAYAMEDLTYDLGTNSGKPAIAVDISYLHNRTEILRIRKAKDMTVAKQMIEDVLDDCGADAVIRVAQYESIDITQLVQDYVESHPDTCMEMPQVTMLAYPQTGSDRILELTFTYQTSRESLRTMQKYVEPVFEAAELNVIGEESESVKFELMYAFLMERSEYQMGTSITPAYSLLRHGVGDSKAFATIYAAMCRRAGLECQVVTGTREGNPWVWNMICEDGVYYHIDLLNTVSEGKLQRLMLQDMTSYVWDYSSYPIAEREIVVEE